MAVDKRIPRVLNSDADSKIINKVSMLDALNLYSGPDNEGLQNGDKSDSGEGVLKNIKGTEEVYIHEGEELPTNCRVLGSVEDAKTSITYLFVYSTDGSGHGVWAYDKNDVLNTINDPGAEPSNTPSIRLIYKSNQFNFPQNGFVKGDIVYSNASKSFPSHMGGDFEKDVIIYFTDGSNEPRKINAYRAFIESSGSNLYPGDIYAEADFITACPKTPLTPITFEFVASQDENRTSNEFVGTRGFQFAYQYVYVDGMESAISPYSDIAFPPSVLNQGAASYVDHSEFNECQLTVPLPGPNIEFVRILCRQGNLGSFLVIEQVEANGFDGLYSFYNDKVLSGVSTDEVNKQFDSVPRTAVAQATSSNRLFYGNYLDGFDNVKVETEEPEVIYHDRQEDFKTFDVKVSPSIAPKFFGNEEKGKTAGFVIDCSELPDVISEGTIFSATIVIKPDSNWHLYRFSGPESSYHQSTQIGPQDQESINQLFDGANQPFFQQTPEQAGETYLEDSAFKLFGNNQGVSESAYWIKSAEISGIGDTALEASYGTSAGNPLILKGGAVSFSAKIKATSNIESQGRIKVNQAIRKCLTEPNDFDLADDLVSDSFELLERSHLPSYSFNLGLGDGDLIAQSFLGVDDTPSSNLSKLIVAVKAQNDPTQTSNVLTNINPAGAFIVNSATVNFSAFVSSDEYIFGDPEKSHFGISVTTIENPEVHTCVHGLSTGASSFSDLQPLSWIVITKDTLADDFNLASFLDSNGLSDSINLTGSLPNQPGSFESVYGNVVNQLSYFHTQDDENGSNLFEPELSFQQGEICLLDGEGGAGGGLSRGGGGNRYDDNFLHLQGSITVNPSFDGEDYRYSDTAYRSGRIKFTDSGPLHNSLTTLPLISSNYEDDVSDFDVYPLPFIDPDTEQLDPNSVNFKRLHSYAEITSAFLSIIPPEGVFDASSFKTEANHDFGVVYYDERGRHGFVNPLDSVYVEGYSKLEREEGAQGGVSIKFKLISTPPDWAHFYKFVYAKNTSVKDFIQYSAGGAFIASNEEQDQDVSNTNIYVSLNYLQGHPISYVSSFGARTPEGGLNFYKFEPGDKLRVISYAEGSLREYPPNLEFEVVDLVKLGGDSNPLSNEPEENQKGDFVVLKNNPNAGGFSFADVAAGTSEWGNNCIIELRTPLKELEDDQRLYYEVGPTGMVVKSQDTGGLIHSPAEVELTQGDVWFRRVAVNVRNLEDGSYPDLIVEDDGADDPSRSNFKNVYLETSAATDLYQSDSISIGRPNVVLEGAKETVREATVTYSDPSNPESTKVNYASFNASLANFKDLSERYGDIQYIGDHNGYIYVIQKERISMIPTGKNVLSDASGTSQLIASLNVLGEVITYPEVSGCDDDPSSVYDSGSNVYFCNKALSKVYRWTRSGGVEDISAKGVSSFIRAALKRAINEGQVRVVGGFDPLKEEYLLSIQNLQEHEVPADIEIVDQPTGAFEPGEGGDGGTDGDGPDTEGPGDFDGTEGTGETGGEGTGGTGGEEGTSGNLVVTPDVLVFDATEIGETSSKPVTLTAVTNEPINVESITFTDPRFSINPAQAFPIVLLPEFGFTNIEVMMFFTPDSAETVSGEIQFTTNDPNQPVVLTDIEGSGVQAGSPDTPSEAAVAFTEAYNDFYLTNISPEDMSKELAIDYLKDLKNDPNVLNHPTFNNIFDLLEEGDIDTVKRFVFDAGGAFEGATTVGMNGNVGNSELLALLSVYGDNYNAEGSLFVPQGTTVASVPPPPVSGNPPPNFETVEEAVQYLEQNKVLRVHDIVRLNKYSNPNIVLNVTNRFGFQVVETQDLLAVLTSFNTVMNGMDSPYGGDVTTDYDTAEYTGSQVIDQIVTEFYDVITVEQYHRILNDQYPVIVDEGLNIGISPIAAVVASSGAFLGYNGADYDYQCSVPTFLFFLSQYGVDNGITLDSLSGNPDIL